LVKGGDIQDIKEHLEDVCMLHMVPMWDTCCVYEQVVDES